jgi:hypothetical protein
MNGSAYLFCFDAAAAPAIRVAAGHAVVGAHHHHHLWEAGYFVSDAA